MTLERVLKEIAAGRLRPVYFVHGEDDYLKRELVRQIGCTFDPALLAFNRDVLYADEAAVKELQTALGALPMMAARRLVILHDVTRAPESTKQYLLSYAARPNPTTVLVVTAPGVDMRRSAFCRRLAEATVSVECRPLSPEALVNWVIQKAGRAGKQWSTEAVQALLDRSGSDLGAVNTEMEKVSILVGERDGIGIEDVRGAFGLSRYSPYALGSAVWAGNLKESLTILSDLLEWGESPGTILYALTRDLLSLLKVRALLDRKVPQQEIVAALCRSRLPIQAARALLEAARERTARELGRNLESVYRVDRAVKSGREESEASLQGLVFALCHRSRACGQPERKRRSQDE